MKEKLPLLLVAVGLILSVVVDFFTIVYATGFSFAISFVSAVMFTILMVIFVWWYAHK